MWYFRNRNGVTWECEEKSVSVEWKHMVQKDTIHRTLCCILAILSVAAIGINMENLEQAGAGGTIFAVLSSFQGWGIGQFLFVICLVCIYDYFYKKIALEKGIALMSLLFSFFMLMGLCYKDAVGIVLILQSPAQMVKACIVVLGYSVMFYAAIYFLQMWLQKAAETKTEEWTNGKTKEKTEDGSKRRGHKNLKTCVILFLCWLPYLIVFYPGTTTYDAGTMLEQYFRYAPLTNHHPYFQILFIGLFVQAGHALGSAAVGMFAYILLQVGAFIAVLVYMMDLLRRIGVGSKVIKILTGIYALCPIFPIYAISVGKNINFSIVILLLTIFLFETAESESDFVHSRVKMILLPILLILICLFRNEGLAFVIGCFPCFIVMAKKYRKVFLGIFTGVLLFALFWFKWLLPFAGVASGSIAEGLSIPFMQTARCVYYYGAEMSEEEIKAIDDVLQFDTLAKRYLPETSDNVKRKYNNEATKEQLQAYLKVYFHQFLEHPVTYVDAVLNKSYGYFYPDDKGKMKSYYVNYADVPTLNEDGFDLKSAFRETVDTLGNILSVFRDIPLIGYTTSVGFYFWCTFLSLFFIIRYRKKLLAIFMPAAVTLFVCVISPVNAYFRYGLPVVFSVPFFVAIVIYAMKSGEKDAQVQQEEQKAAQI
ncbi:MAG: DUF6020 family protein [Lachnoclostridium sp.]|nr:DUF6020 family protein [Lachnoclostridium sp.]